MRISLFDIILIKKEMQMKKFEYKFIQLYAQDGINIKLASKNKAEALEEFFNPLGREGWELVHIHLMEGLAVFKREI